MRGADADATWSLGLDIRPLRAICLFLWLAPLVLESKTCIPPPFFWPPSDWPLHSGSSSPFLCAALPFPWVFGGHCDYHRHEDRNRNLGVLLPILISNEGWCATNVRSQTCKCYRLLCVTSIDFLISYLRVSNEVLMAVVALEMLCVCV